MNAFDRPLVVSVAVVSLALVLAVGLWTARRTRTRRDYFIAGQGLGLLVTGIATMSAAFSGFVFVGGPGLTYRLGVASLLIVLPVSFTAALLCWSVGERLRAMARPGAVAAWGRGEGPVRPGARVDEVLTVPDALALRFGSALVRGLAALAVLVGSVAYLGAQLLALGLVLESILGTRAALGAWSLPVAVGLGLAVLLTYAVVGGMVAGAWTDLVQGLLMLVAAVAVAWRALEVGGGPGGIVDAIAGSEAFGAAFLDPFGTVPAVTALGFFFVFGIGVLGQPQMLHKFFMLDDPGKLRWLPLVLAVAQSLCVLLWLGVGLAVPALVARGELAALARPDDAAAAFLLGFVPEALAGLVAAGVVAAVMSTADSFINLGAAALVRDLPRALGRPLDGAPEDGAPGDEAPASAAPAGDSPTRVGGDRELTWSRRASLLVAAAAAGLAVTYGDLVALLGTFAFGTFGAALTPALAVGLAWRRVTARAAAASIAVGFVASIGLELAGDAVLVPGALPAAAALAASFVTLFLVTLLEPALTGVTGVTGGGSGASGGEPAPSAAARSHRSAPGAGRTGRRR